jgi:MFS family permease
MPPYALFMKDDYGLKSFGAIYGGIMVLTSLGMAVGGYLGGFLFDLSGSYQPAWILSLVATVTAFVALDLAPRMHPQRRHQSEEEVGAPASIATSSSPA